MRAGERRCVGEIERHDQRAVRARGGDFAQLVFLPRRDGHTRAGDEQRLRRGGADARAHDGGGEVDAGVVYSTDAQMRAREVRIVSTAPGSSHKPIAYPIAAVKGTRNEAASKGFVSFILSQEGKKILAKYGFK